MTELIKIFSAAWFVLSVLEEAIQLRIVRNRNFKIQNLKKKKQVSKIENFYFSKSGKFQKNSDFFKLFSIFFELECFFFGVEIFFWI